MTKLSSKILDKIKKEKVTPRSRFYFILIHTLLGTAVLTSIMIGGIAIAIVIRHFTVTDWELANKSMGGHLRSFFMLIPYIWIIFIGLTIFLADLLFKHTKKGYRLRPWKIVAGSVFVSAILGNLFFFAEADKPIEEGLRKNIPPYAQWEIIRHQAFASPENGVLAGEILMINEDQEWILIDFKNMEWYVDISDASSPPRISFNVGMRVGMTGQATDQNHFKAIRISPWRKEIIHLQPPKPIEKK